MQVLLVCVTSLEDFPIYKSKAQDTADSAQVQLANTILISVEQKLWGSRVSKQYPQYMYNTFGGKFSIAVVMKGQTL